MKDKIKIYTDLQITPLNSIGVKRYYHSIKRNLPENWSNEIKYNYNDQDSFELYDNIMCLKTPYYRDVALEVTFQGRIYLGLADNHIVLLRTELTIDLTNEKSIGPIGYIINNLHEEVLKPNKHYSSFRHEFAFGGPTDENWYKRDIRSTRHLRFNSKKDGQIYALIKGSQVAVDGRTVFFSEPNNIALSLSIMKKSCKKAKKLFLELGLSSNKSKIEIKSADTDKLYDYFEEIVTGLTFSFIAVEAMANAAIPSDYVYEVINERGIKEAWPKESIERWMSTSTKVSDILPLILNAGNIKKEIFWTKFKELESLRNDIVHQKTIENGTQLDSGIFTKLMNPKIFTIVRSSIDVINYFHKIDNAHPYFPLGFGIARFKVVDIESMDQHFKKVDD